MKGIRYITVFVLLVAIIGCHRSNKTAPQDFKARIFQTDINQFGYDINKHNILIIHQPNVPCVSGNKGFATKDDAGKVAALVIYKLENGVTPPSVSLMELDSLNVTIK